MPKEKKCKNDYKVLQYKILKKDDKITWGWV